MASFHFPPQALTFRKKVIKTRLWTSGACLAAVSVLLQSVLATFLRKEVANDLLHAVNHLGHASIVARREDYLPTHTHTHARRRRYVARLAGTSNMHNDATDCDEFRLLSLQLQTLCAMNSTFVFPSTTVPIRHSIEAEVVHCSVLASPLLCRCRHEVLPDARGRALGSFGGARGYNRA